MGQAGGALDELMPDAEVGVLFSVPSKWALSFAPPLVRADGSPDPLSYERIVSAFYRGFFRAGAQMRLLHAERELPDAAQLASELPVLIAAGYYVADDRVLDWLRTYAEAGGHLVLGPRTGYANPEAAARTERMPARLFEVAGAGYQEYSDLQAPVACEPTSESDLRLSDGAAATAWIDGLEVEGARVLARYRHPHFGRWAAVPTIVMVPAPTALVVTAAQRPKWGCRYLASTRAPSTSSPSIHRGGGPVAQSATPAPATPVFATSQSKPASSASGKYMVQVGAFSQEANAKALQKKLKAIGQDSTIDHPSLYLVRIGPFDTRDQAVSVRSKLEASGISAIITSK